MRAPLRLWFLTFLAYGVLCAGIAHAATPNEKKADALYTEGSALFQKGRYDEALKRLDESQQLDPGTGTLLLLASCHEKLGHWRPAYVAFREARTQSVAAHNEDRVKYAQERLDALRERVVTLIITRAASVDGERVVVDDTAYVVARGDEGMVLDPGDHKVVYEAPNYIAQRVFLRDLKGVQRLLLPGLQPLPSSDPVAPEPAKQTGGVPTWAWATGAAGVVTLGGAVAIQMTALSADTRSAEAAKRGDEVSRNSEHSDALSYQRAAWVVGGVGLALTGAGIYGIVTAPKAESGVALRVTPWLGPVQGVGLSGRW